ncbi:MAG: long-chain-fatty-acid--CoA ligase [Acidobacteriota bacterium]|nr:long-chain-fatty-acid--CoA ligase [Acidobacteriota bacterium]
MRIHDYLDLYARETPDATFATFDGEQCTYAEAAVATDRIAFALAESGFEKGDRLGILAKNCLDYVLIYYGAFKAGVITVPLNYRLAGPEWAYIINDAAIKGIIARGELAEAVDQVMDDLETVELRYALDADPPPGWEAFDDWLDGASGARPDRQIDDSEDVYIMYTSGTTGHPKGAILTHRAVCSNLIQWTGTVVLEQGQGYLIVAPLYHAAAGVSLFATVAQGACGVIHEDFFPDQVVNALDDGSVSAATLVPAMIQACLVMVPDIAERKFESLDLVAYGASPIAEATLRQAIEVFGCDFVQGYGMTETTAVLTLLPWSAHQRALAGEGHLLLSAGRAVLGTELRIVDENDEEVPHGEIGEIAARGPQLMRGYLNKPEATAEALEGGWMHTGDAGTMDDEGFVFIQDRVKDMVVTGSENVYPREVEEVIFQHPAVADAAVIGVPDDKWGETLKAIVVLREGETLEPEGLIDHCREKLAGFKIPRSVDMIAELPRNASGKVLKKDLREPYWKGHERRVG